MSALEVTSDTRVFKVNNEDRFFRSDEKTANMNKENVEDRAKLVGKIEDLIDALRNPQ